MAETLEVLLGRLLESSKASAMVREMAKGLEQELVEAVEALEAAEVAKAAEAKARRSAEESARAARSACRARA